MGIIINPEYSAQGKHAKPNPLVQKAILYFKTVLFQGRNLSKLRIADQGCGNLRHIRLFQRSFKRLFLVDTWFQINRIHRIGKQKTTLAKYIQRLNVQRPKYTLLNDQTFRRMQLELDVIVCACTMDAVPKRVRKELVEAAASNLKPGGYYCVIVPRNDQTITSRCRSDNAYEDGHVFRRNQSVTFFANFSEGSRVLKDLHKLLKRAHLSIVADLSVYRQACIILQKQRGQKPKRPVVFP